MNKINKFLFFLLLISTQLFAAKEDLPPEFVQDSRIQKELALQIFSFMGHQNISEGEIAGLCLRLANDLEFQKEFLEKWRSSCGVNECAGLLVTLSIQDGERPQDDGSSEGFPLLKKQQENERWYYCPFWLKRMLRLCAFGGLTLFSCVCVVYIWILVTKENIIENALGCFNETEVLQCLDVRCLDEPMRQCLWDFLKFINSLNN